MTLEQQVGQVFTVGTPAGDLDPATASAVRDRHVEVPVGDWNGDGTDTIGVRRPL